MFLALPVAVGPFAVHGGMAGEVSISGDDLVHVFAVDEIVIDVVGHLGPERHFLLVVGKNGFGIIVPQYAVALSGNQKGRDRIGVGLHQLDGMSAIVHVAVLVLAEAVNAFVRGEFEILLDAEGVFFMLDVSRRNNSPALLF